MHHVGSWEYTAFKDTKCPIFRKQPVPLWGSPWLLLQIPGAKQNLPEQLGKTGASWLLQIHTWDENMCTPILCRPPSLPSCENNCPTLHYPPSTSKTLTWQSKGDGFLSVVFSYSFFDSGILFSNSFLFSEIHSIWQIAVEQFWIRRGEDEGPCWFTTTSHPQSSPPPHTHMLRVKSHSQNPPCNIIWNYWGRGNTFSSINEI